MNDPCRFTLVRHNAHTGRDVYRCDVCQRPEVVNAGATPQRTCGQTPVVAPQRTQATTTRSPGPGTCLHNLIVRWTGQHPRPGCKCENYCRIMNQWGPAKCRRKLRKIVGWLRAEARQRRWFRFAAIVPGASLGLRFLVLQAIAKSEQENAAHGQLENTS